MPYGTVNADVIQTSTSGGALGAGDSSAIKNRIINGAMVIDQRFGGASGLNNSTSVEYVVDRWNIYGSAATKFSAQQNAGSVTPPAGFSKYLGITSSSAYTVGASEVFRIAQPIEGFNTADFGWGTANAKTVTLSFQVYSSLTGTFGGSLTNENGDRSYPFTYTISSANTWTSASVTIAGDTTGTWVGATNGVGIYLFFGLGVGSTNSGTAGAWAAANYRSATGATSVVGTSGATFYITGVQLEVGSSATGFEYRQYGTELALCQRYYFKVKPAAFSVISTGGYNSSTTVFQGFLQYPVTMRTAPTALEQSGTAAHYDVINQSGATACSAVPTFQDATDTIARTGFTVSSGLTSGGAGTARTGNAAGFLAWSAEL